MIHAVCAEDSGGDFAPGLGPDRAPALDELALLAAVADVEGRVALHVVHVVLALIPGSIPITSAPPAAAAAAAAEDYYLVREYERTSGCR